VKEEEEEMNESKSKGKLIQMHSDEFSEILTDGKLSNRRNQQ
jgi:hypothetical protein